MATTLQALLNKGFDPDYLSGLSDSMRSRLAASVGIVDSSPTVPVTTAQPTTPTEADINYVASVTGLPSTVNKKIDSATSTVATAATKTVGSVVSGVTSGTAKAYNNIKDAINSNVPKQG